jgi:NodT family efflux transporter outer membrane factor (OMF) lipoprotein
MAAMRARRLRRSFSLVPLLLCSACLSVPDLGERPEPRAPETYAATFAAPAAGWPADRWWDGYGDAHLTQLIDEALAGSPTMAEAEARVRRALANAQQAGSRLQPQIDATASGGMVQQSENLGMPSAAVPQGWNDNGQMALSLTFDLDLWGRNRANLRAAMSDTDAARADMAYARLTLSTAIASSYADLARLGAVRATGETYLRLRGETLRLMQAREAQGLENHGAVMRAESGRAAAAADLAAVDEQIDLTRNGIAALTGQGPDRGRAIALPAAARLDAFGLPANVGIDIIGRRPDIVAARARAESGTQRIRAARAEFYPNIQLSALIGLQALGIGNLLGGGSFYGSAGPAISLPIFSGGRIEGGYRGARADHDAAVAQYDQIVVDALREVADVATRQRALGRRLGESRAALAASNTAFNLIEARYRGGLATYLDVLTAEDSLNSSRRAVAELESSAFALDVALVRALGGGFHQTPAA